MNTFGHRFKVTLYGESHQAAIGVVVEGLPPGTPIDESKIEADLKRRNPEAIGTTPRKEPDRFSITSGVFEGKATGSPIHITIPNENVRSKDYSHLQRHFRPGHADFVANLKYQGHHDYRGGGRFSGRLTAPLVAAGSLAKMMLPYRFSHELIQVGTLKDLSKIDEYLAQVAAEGDSVGGIIRLTVENLPVGLGEPMFGKIEALAAQMLFSIPAVKGVEFGTGFEGITMKGSAFNDVIIDDKGTTQSNHSGGTSGGLSNGNPLVVKVFIKPTSSIQKTQHTYALDKGKMENLEIKGRHDVCIARRAGIVLENVLALVLADLTLLNAVPTSIMVSEG